MLNGLLVIAGAASFFLRSIAGKAFLILFIALAMYFLLAPRVVTFGDVAIGLILDAVLITLSFFFSRTRSED